MHLSQTIIALSRRGVVREGKSPSASRTLCLYSSLWTTPLVSGRQPQAARLPTRHALRAYHPESYTELARKSELRP